MVIFITGKAGAGKTTLANKLKTDKDIIIDGDDFRRFFKAGYSLEDKKEHITRMAKTAAFLEEQGFRVIVAAILPTKELRQLARFFCKQTFLIYLAGGSMWDGTDYEIPTKDELCLNL